MSELKPWVRLVEALLAHEKGWSGLMVAADRWAMVVDECLEIAAEFLDRGKAMNRYRARAAITVARLAEEVEARELLVTVAAMHLLRECRPGRFKSDRAFSWQVIRRCRNLTKTARGSWFNEATGKVRHVYSTPPEAEMLILGGHLSRAFGALGLGLARAVVEQQEAAGDVERRTMQAMRELKKEKVE